MGYPGHHHGHSPHGGFPHGYSPYNGLQPTCRYDGPNVCEANQMQLLLSIITTLVVNRNIKQFCGEPNLKPNYDFIVVGGGSAGSVVAARLSEIEEWNVLLIEAGPEEPLETFVPSMVASLIGSDLDWKYSTTGEKNACLSKGGNCYWPRCKNLGGCSVHNGLMYIRGNELDYKKWNLSDWEWDDVMPYFKRSENNKEFKNRYHSTGGPLDVDKFPHQPDIAEDILKAAYEKGYGRTDDLNGDKITGFTIAQTNNNDGIRVSSATAFLRPVRERKNLDVLLEAQVTKLIFDRNNKQRVVGVEYVKKGYVNTVRAKREVILSAGSIGSPHILLLSGIGPENDLKSKNVPVVKNLPGVGENLQNHVSYTITFEINDLQSDLFTKSIDQYKKDQSGPLSSTGLSQMTGIIPSSKADPKNPDIQYYFRGYNAGCDIPAPGKRRVGMVAAYLHPKSRGTLKLKTNNYTDHPIITQNYLSEEDDLNGVLEAVKIALDISKADALKKYDFNLTSDPIEACKNISIDNDDYWKCAIKQNTDPENHQGGSCKMGLKSDPLAVVDTELKVIGVKGLRVADGSVLPSLTSGNIAAPIMMIGERVSDFIKKDHLKLRGIDKLLNQIPAMNVLSILKPKQYPYTPYIYGIA